MSETQPRQALLNEITITEPIENYQPGTYKVVYLTQFIFQGQIHPKDAERLLNLYPDCVKASYADIDKFGWSDSGVIE